MIRLARVWMWVTVVSALVLDMWFDRNRLCRWLSVSRSTAKVFDPSVLTNRVMVWLLLLRVRNSVCLKPESTRTLTSGEIDGLIWLMAQALACSVWLRTLPRPAVTISCLIGRFTRWVTEFVKTLLKPLAGMAKSMVCRGVFRSIVVAMQQIIRVSMCV